MYQDMPIVFDQFLPKWNYKAVPFFEIFKLLIFYSILGNVEPASWFGKLSRYRSKAAETNACIFFAVETKSTRKGKRLACGAGFMYSGGSCPIKLFTTDMEKIKLFA
ncbi:MAG: hypothetical protein D3924_11285 [Candidatus Electrothrix sp. AR4]|nr:hypothetical protein [Candidatus Electrothrix sp. AR4]